MAKANKRRRGAAPPDAVDMDFTISGISFSSYPGSFRFVSAAGSEGLVLRLEKPKSPQQWQVTITDIAKHGASGIPQEAVFSALKSSLESLQCENLAENQTGKKAAFVNGAGSVDVEAGDSGSIILYLDLSFFGASITYNFEMLPVAREQVDILESQLHDAQEEIARLQHQVAELKASSRDPILISLRSSTSCANGQEVVWNILDYNTDEQCFLRSADNKAITVTQRGYYQVSVRLSDSAAGCHRKTIVLINGTECAASHVGEESGYYKSATINDVFLLEPDNVIQVRNDGSTTTTMTQAPTSNFTILRL